VKIGLKTGFKVFTHVKPIRKTETIITKRNKKNRILGTWRYVGIKFRVKNFNVRNFRV
jgi:hypothetical protein